MADGRSEEVRGGEASFEDDDDPSSWIPLEPSADTSLGTNVRSEGSTQGEIIPWSKSLRSAVEMSPDNAPRRGRVGSSQAAAAPSSMNKSESRNLVSLQRKLEDRQQLRGSLLDHPMSQFPGKFASRWLVELLSMDTQVRVGLTILSIGTLLQILALVNLFASYKRSIFLVLVFAASYLLVYRADKKAQKFIEFFSSLDDPSHFMEAIFSGLENVDSVQLRHLFLALAVIPSMFEMRAIQFLAGIISEGGWIAVATTAVCTHALTICSKLSAVPSRDCSLRAMILLYMFALLVAIAQVQDLNRINALAAPFIIAAGSMILSNRYSGEFDWLSHSVRQALRLTLRDILVEVQGKVLEDEMLQLVILRWVVDYWGSKENCASDVPGESSASIPSASTTAPAWRRAENAPSPRPPRRRPSSASGGGTDSWRSGIESETMTSMLQITTDQMRQEVGDNVIDQRPMSHDDQKGEDELYETSESFDNLCTMLASMDVDSRAKPAVQAYRASIERIPPGRNAAVLVALIRRCPSLLSFVMWNLRASSERHLLKSAVVLLPLILLELSRVKEWAKSCAIFSTETPEMTTALSYWLPPSNVSDTVFILLCPDKYEPSKPPHLIQVWLNLQSSVIALERSLLAMRCVQTTCAATELTFSIISLARLGAEIKDRGWGYGLSVLANDILHFVRPRSCHRAVGATGYAAAAVKAFKNGQVIARNVSRLMEEDEGNQLIARVIDVFAISLGRGWIWNCEKSSIDGQNFETSIYSLCRNGTEYESIALRRDGCADLKMERGQETAPEKPCENDNSNEGHSTTQDSAIEILEDSALKRRNSTNAAEVNIGSVDVLSASRSLVHSFSDKSVMPGPVALDKLANEQAQGNEGVEDDTRCAEICETRENGDGGNSSQELAMMSEALAPTSKKEAEQITPSQPFCNEGGDDWVKWAGGGLAVVATVVGILLANSGNNDTDSGCDEAQQRDRNEQATNSSTDEKEAMRM